jgi:hypothetical protein
MAAIHAFVAQLGKKRVPLNLRVGEGDHAREVAPPERIHDLAGKLHVLLRHRLPPFLGEPLGGCASLVDVEVVGRVLRHVPPSIEQREYQGHALALAGEECVEHRGLRGKARKLSRDLGSSLDGPGRLSDPPREPADAAAKLSGVWGADEGEDGGNVVQCDPRIGSLWGAQAPTRLPAL